MELSFLFQKLFNNSFVLQMLRTYIKEDSYQETKLNIALESMLEQKRNQVIIDSIKRYVRFDWSSKIILTKLRIVL
jgi:hypothetical protein